MSWYLQDLTASADSKTFHYSRSDKQPVDFFESCKAVGKHPDVEDKFLPPDVEV